MIARGPGIGSHFRKQVKVWVTPAVYLVISIALGRIVPAVDQWLLPDQTLFSIVTANSLLSSIASGMIAFTGFVFSMTFLFLQFGSSAYSPRLTEYFFQDTVIRHALGMFPATFVYALFALGTIDAGGTGSVSDLTVLVALLGVLGSIVMFLALIQRVSILQINNVLHMIGARGRQVINALYPEALPEEKILQEHQTGQRNLHEQARLALPKATQVYTYTGDPLAVLEYDLKRLVELARDVDGVIRICIPVGDTVVAGSAVLEVLGGKERVAPQALARSVSLGRQRTIEQDPKYAIRLIVDIAIRGLSPAINDPTTAVQALDQLEDLLRRLGTHHLDNGKKFDVDGGLRVIVPTPTWEDFLDLALDEIRYYGATSVQVMRRLRALLVDLVDAVPEERDGLLHHHLARVNASIRRSFADLEDRIDAGQADRQGIGLSRQSDDQDENDD